MRLAPPPSTAAVSFSPDHPVGGPFPIRSVFGAEGGGSEAGRVARQQSGSAQEVGVGPVHFSKFRKEHRKLTKPNFK